MNKDIDTYTGSCLLDQEPSIEQLIADYVKDTIKNKTILDLSDIINVYTNAPFEVKIVMLDADMKKVAKKLNIPL